MTIHFGKYSLKRYAKGVQLIDCIPGEETTDWIDINTDDQTIALALQ